MNIDIYCVFLVTLLVSKAAAGTAIVSGTVSFSNNEILVGDASGTATVTGNATINDASATGPGSLIVNTGNILQAPAGSTFDSITNRLTINNDGNIEGFNVVVDAEISNGVATGIATVAGPGTITDPNIDGVVNSADTVVITGTIRTEL